MGWGNWEESVIGGTGDTVWLGNETEVTGAKVKGTLETQWRRGEIGKIGGNTGMECLGTGALGLREDGAGEQGDRMGSAGQWRHMDGCGVAGDRAAGTW